MITKWREFYLHLWISLKSSAISGNIYRTAHFWVSSTVYGRENKDIYLKLGCIWPHIPVIRVKVVYANHTRIKLARCLHVIETLSQNSLRTEPGHSSRCLSDLTNYGLSCSRADRWAATIFIQWKVKYLHSNIKNIWFKIFPKKISR